MLKKIALRHTNNIQNHTQYFQTLCTYLRKWYISRVTGREKSEALFGKARGDKFYFFEYVKIYFCVVHLGLTVHIPDRINILLCYRCISTANVNCTYYIIMHNFSFSSRVNIVSCLRHCPADTAVLVDL